MSAEFSPVLCLPTKAEAMIKKERGSVIWNRNLKTLSSENPSSPLNMRSDPLFLARS